MDFETLIYAFVRELRDFDYALSCTDHVWNVLFPDEKGRWNHLNINKYKRTFYIAHINGDYEVLEVEPGKAVRVGDIMGSSHALWKQTPEYLDETWRPLIVAARRWLRITRTDWIRAGKRVQAEYPLDYRCGIVPNSLVRASLSDIYRLDLGLGKAKSRKLVRLVEQGFFMRRENAEVATMSANDYFNYCKIAYIAGKRKDDVVDENMSGREMYACHADGRHEGLLDIDPNSEEEFAAWIDHNHPKRGGGGHPWEIKRGGNTTHISLSVSRPLYLKKGFDVELRGESIVRMVETMQMLLAIHSAGLPITIANPEGVRKRLLAQDNIGIIPKYDSLHRANQRFPKEKDVFDVIHYSDLGRFRRRITPFITWQPLPILKPQG